MIRASRRPSRSQKGGRPLGARAPPVRFGFREFWIILSPRFLPQRQSHHRLRGGTASSSWQRHRRAKGDLPPPAELRMQLRVRRSRRCGARGAPGFEEILRAAEAHVGTPGGALSAHDRQYTWTGTDADNNNGYAPLAQFYTHVAGNHPSVIAYAMAMAGATLSSTTRTSSTGSRAAPPDPTTAPRRPGRRRKPL